MKFEDNFMLMAERANLQMLGALVMQDGEPPNTIKKPFTVRMDEAYQKLEPKINALVTPHIAEEIQLAYSEYISTLISIYFSSGMKIGAKINAQLMDDFDKDYR